MSLYRVEDLTIRFGDRRVVDGLSFAVEPGECLAIVGESGSGKSQACLAPFGLSLATVSGSARIADVELVSADEETRRRARGTKAGFIFQQPLSALTPHLTIGRQLSESLGRRASRAELAGLLDEVRLTDPQRRLAQFPHELSGGMRQRVMIAMALARRPDLLIADEPTTALDVLVQREILDLVDGLRRERGLATILVSHDLALVAGRADRIVVMRNGRAVEWGRAARVLSRPRARLTKDLVAAAPRLDSALPDRPSIGPALLEARGISVAFARPKGLFRTEPVPAVVDANLVVHAGEGVGIVGASGSGKSTLARAIARLGPSSAGETRWRGTPLPPRGQIGTVERRGFQVVFQDPVDSLDPRLPAADAVAEALVTLRPDIAPKDRATRVVRAMRDVDFDPQLWSRRPRELSGGQAQRLCLARALVAEPDLLICDEATSALDVTVQAGIVGLLERLQRERGLALLFISHDLALVCRLCHHVLVLDAGRIVEAGPTDAVIRSPQSEAARRLVEAVPALG